MESEFNKFIRSIENKSWLDRIAIRLLLWLDYDLVYGKWCAMEIKRCTTISGLDNLQKFDIIFHVNQLKQTKNKGENKMKKIYIVNKVSESSSSSGYYEDYWTKTLKGFTKKEDAPGVFETL